MRSILREDEEGKVAKDWVYGQYEAFCKQRKMKVKQKTIFAKLFYQVFPYVSSRRMGSGAQQQSCYCGLSIIENEKEEEEEKEKEEEKRCGEKNKKRKREKKEETNGAKKIRMTTRSQSRKVKKGAKEEEDEENNNTDKEQEQEKTRKEEAMTPNDQTKEKSCEGAGMYDIILFRQIIFPLIN